MLGESSEWKEKTGFLSLRPPCPHRPPFSLWVSHSPVGGERVGTFSPSRREYSSKNDIRATLHCTICDLFEP